MANQPPVRPWFRLASLRSVPAAAPAPAPAPAPGPRPPLALSTFRTASAPPSPQTQPSQPSEPTPPPPAPEPTAATPRPAPAITAAQFTGAADRASAASSPALVASHTQSPKTRKPDVESTMQSPKLKLITPPPSPLTLPPSLSKTYSKIEPKIPVEPEPKTVLVQKTIDKPKQWLNGNGASQRESGETWKHGIAHHEKQVTAKETETKGKGTHKKLSDSEDSGFRVITLAGENRGAYMEVMQSPTKKHEFGDKPKFLHKKGNSKIKDNGNETENSSSGEGNANRKDKSHKQRTTSSSLLTAYMNSNVQSVNNSLLYNTSCSSHDPGTRLCLSKKPFGEGFHLKQRVDGQHS